MPTGRQQQFEIITSSQGRGWHGPLVRLPSITLTVAAVAVLLLLQVFCHRLQAADLPAAAGQDPIVDDNDPRVKVALARAAAFLQARGTPPQLGELSLSINALAKI